jgi:hypothetical protein
MVSDLSSEDRHQHGIDNDPCCFNAGNCFGDTPAASWNDVFPTPTTSAYGHNLSSVVDITQGTEGLFNSASFYPALPGKGPTHVAVHNLNPLFFLLGKSQANTHPVQFVSEERMIEMIFRNPMEPDWSYVKHATT